ncbi:MmpS family transport accessory protein [Yinghuangia aomiensis]
MPRSDWPRPWIGRRLFRRRGHRQAHRRLRGRRPRAADVRYAVDDPDSDGEEAKNVASGWTKSVEVTTPGTLMHMTVYTSPSEAPDETITCRVTLDGKVVDEKTQKRSNVSDALQCEADLSER